MLTLKISLEQLAKFRRLIMRAIVEYLDSNDWLEVTSSTLAPLTGACETISTIFTLEYFGRNIHLSQTGQLQLEWLIKTLKRKVWTNARSFRAEPRVSERHLTEFTLVELESPGFTLKEITETQEAILKRCIARMNEEEAKLPSLVRDRLGFLESIRFPLERVEYAKALEILNAAGMHRNWGDELGSEEEAEMLRQLDHKPFFLTKFPAAIKFFNMRRSDDGLCAYR
jgi:asparaginyl-tRNA synthetase